MKIAMLKQECSDGDKATITGKVKWIGEVATHEGSQGMFKTQSLLVADGEQTDDKQNSIFCDFYADKCTYDDMKGKEITVQGVVNVYQGKTSMKSCKIKGQNAAQNTQQGRSQPAQGQKPDKPVDWDAKDFRYARMNGLSNATRLICLIAEADKDFANSGGDALVSFVKKTANIFVEYIYKGLAQDEAAEFAKEQNLGEDSIPGQVKDYSENGPAADDIPWENA